MGGGGGGWEAEGGKTHSSVSSSGTDRKDRPGQSLLQFGTTHILINSYQTFTV